MITSKKEALRLARTIISDMVVYNRDLFDEGIKNDNVFELMNPKIQEGLKFYKDQVAPNIIQDNNFYNEALIDIVLVEGTEIESKIW